MTEGERAGRRAGRGGRLVALVGVVLACLWGFTLYSGWQWNRNTELAERYAAALSHCLNGGNFAVENRIVRCIAIDIVVY